MKHKVKRNLTITFSSNQGTLKDFIIGSLDEVRNVTLWTVKDLTISQLDWRYMKEWNSIGSLLEHIDSSENVFRIRYLERRALTQRELHTFGPGLVRFGSNWRLFRGNDFEYYLKKLRLTRKLTMDKMLSLSEAELTKPFSGSVTNANLAYGFFHLFEDELQHKGQMVMIKKTFDLDHNL